ncbi:MAG UNVERIFIED_CONTAM: fumarylacetoacetate hydrolase family protein [Anaerolineae bacterium]
MKQDLPSHPLIFGIFPSALIGSGGVIRWKRAITNEVDWEGELAVIIGKPAHRVAEADALDYVFGYTIANDVTARDLQHRIDKQWTRGKSLDTFCPLGPAITFARDVENVQNLDVTTTVNGEIMQHGSTADMIFSVAYLVSYCSQMFTLYPGDMILTGTPSGVGAGRKPPVFLRGWRCGEHQHDRVGHADQSLPKRRIEICLLDVKHVRLLLTLCY